MEFPRLFQYPLGLRIGFLILLILVTIRYTNRGMQNGILLGMIAGLNILKLFENEFGLPPISLERIVWPLVFLFFLRHYWHGATQKRAFDGVEYGMMALTAIMAMSLWRHGGGSLSELTPILRGLCIPFAAYFIVRRSIFTDWQLHGFCIGLGYITLYLIFTGFAEILGISELVFPKNILDPNAGTHYGRARGIFLNASQLGMAISMVLPIFIWLFFSDAGKRRWLWLFASVCAAFPLAHTIQRAAWLSASMAVIVTGLAWPSKRIFSLSLLLLLIPVGLILAPNTLTDRIGKHVHHENSINFRLALIHRSWMMVRQNPLTGIGLTRFEQELPNYTNADVKWSRRPFASHNTVLTFWAELGIVGVLPYIAILILPLLETAKRYWFHPEFRAFIGVLWGMSMPLLITMMLVDIREELYANTLYFSLWGIGLEAIRQRVAVKPSAAPAVLASKPHMA